MEKEGGMGLMAVSRVAQYNEQCAEALGTAKRHRQEHTQRPVSRNEDADDVNATHANFIIFFFCNTSPCTYTVSTRNFESRRYSRSHLSSSARIVLMPQSDASCERDRLIIHEP